MVDVHSKFGNQKGKKYTKKHKMRFTMNIMVGNIYRTELQLLYSNSQTIIQELAENLTAVASFPTTSHAKEERRHYHYSLVT